MLLWVFNTNISFGFPVHHLFNQSGCGGLLIETLHHFSFQLQINLVNSYHLSHLYLNDIVILRSLFLFEIWKLKACFEKLMETHRFLQPILVNYPYAYVPIFRNVCCDRIVNKALLTAKWRQIRLIISLQAIETIKEEQNFFLGKIQIFLFKGIH